MPQGNGQTIVFGERKIQTKHYDVFWKPGVSNLGDYFTKHHSPAHHKGMIPLYLHFSNSKKAYTRVCYSKCTSNITQGKHMLT